MVSHETCVVYNICNSVPRGTTYLARNLPHPATVRAEPLMTVYLRSSCGNICYFSVYTVLEIRIYDCISGLEFAPKLTDITMLYHL